MSERILSKYNLEILALADASQEYSGDLVAKLASRILDLEAENAALKRNLSDALDCCFEKLLPIWRELPIDYQELKRKVKEVMK